MTKLAFPPRPWFHFHHELGKKEGALQFLTVGRSWQIVLLHSNRSHHHVRREMHYSVSLSN
jgi:hypothetical protein